MIALAIEKPESLLRHQPDSRKISQQYLEVLAWLNHWLQDLQHMETDPSMMLMEPP